MLNALHCLRRAEARDRLQWLVHVDSDELFDPGARSIHDHFRYLEASRFDWFCYHNFEAVPEVAYQTEVDPFLTVSLFKRAACLVPDAAKAVSETWRARNFGIDPFLFYANGKTAVRCGVGACPVNSTLCITEGVVGRERGGQRVLGRRLLGGRVRGLGGVGLELGALLLLRRGAELGHLVACFVCVCRV